MNKGMLTVGIIILALMSLLLINVISNYSTGSELDYYLVKETAEAAMEESVDPTYKKNGQIRLDSDKFVENFLVRFANSVDKTRSYNITFYSINEVPPKVSVKVDSLTVLSFDESAIELSTTYDGIIEASSTNSGTWMIQANRSGFYRVPTGIKDINTGGYYEYN